MMKASNLAPVSQKGPVPDPLIMMQVYGVTATGCRVEWQVYGYWGGVVLYKDGVRVHETSSGGRFDFTELESKTTYTFSVRPKTYGSGSPNSKSVTITTPRGKPSPPSYFEAFYQTASEVSFFWGPGTVDGGEPRYEIKRDGVLLETPNQAPYKDTSPQQGKKHHYCIRTFDDGFNYSEPLCVDVEFGDFTAPTAPFDLRASNLGLSLSWDDSYDSSGEVIYRVDQGVGHKLGETINSEFAVTDLIPGQSYEFGVVAVDPTGNESNRVFIRYPKVGIPLKAVMGESLAQGQSPELLPSNTSRFMPTPPTHFVAFEQTASEVSFYWHGGAVETGLPQYEICRDGQLLETPNRPPYTDRKPQQGRNHQYCIRTFDESFRYSEPVCIEVYFPDFTAPTDPTNLRTTELGLTLTWEPSYDSSDNITYIVEQDGVESGRTRETEFAVTGLEPGVRYHFSVRAMDGAGHESEPVSIQYPALGIPLKGKP